MTYLRISIRWKNHIPEVSLPYGGDRSLLCGLCSGRNWWCSQIKFPPFFLPSHHWRISTCHLLYNRSLSRFQTPSTGLLCPAFYGMRKVTILFSLARSVCYFHLFSVKLPIYHEIAIIPGSPISPWFQIYVQILDSCTTPSPISLLCPATWWFPFGYSEGPLICRCYNSSMRSHR